MKTQRSTRSENRRRWWGGTTFIVVAILVAVALVSTAAVFMGGGDGLAARAAGQDEHLEEPRAGGTTGDRHARGVDQHPSLDAARSGCSAHRRFHLRLSTGALRAEGQASEFVPFRLSDAAADQQIEATLTPRLLGDGNVEVQVSLKLTVGSVSRRLETSVIVRPGKTVTVGTLGVGKRRVEIRLNAKTFEPKPAWLPSKKSR